MLQPMSGKAVQHFLNGFFLTFTDNVAVNTAQVQLSNVYFQTKIKGFSPSKQVLNTKPMFIKI